MESNVVQDAVLRCKSSTDANKLAGSIFTLYQSNNNNNSKISIKVIGAGALNQAVKAAIISNKFFAKKGIVIALQPSFQECVENITAIELKVLFQKI